MGYSLRSQENYPTWTWVYSRMCGYWFLMRRSRVRCNLCSDRENIFDPSGILGSECDVERKAMLRVIMGHGGVSHFFLFFRALRTLKHDFYVFKPLTSTFTNFKLLPLKTSLNLGGILPLGWGGDAIQSARFVRRRGGCIIPSGGGALSERAPPPD